MALTRKAAVRRHRPSWCSHSHLGPLLRITRASGSRASSAVLPRWRFCAVLLVTCPPDRRLPDNLRRTTDTEEVSGRGLWTGVRDRRAVDGSWTQLLGQ